MAIESKNHRPSGVKEVLVSQGSRSDAKPSDKIRFDSYEDEQEHWVLEKKRIETELTAYSKAAFMSEQARIRKENRNNQRKSFDQWVARKAQMDRERQTLIHDKLFVEQQLSRLKPLVKAEKKRNETYEPSFSNAIERLIVEVQQTNSLLSRLIAGAQGAKSDHS